MRDQAITAENEHAHVQSNDRGDDVASFRAPNKIKVLDCAGDKIAAGCKSGEVLHQLAWLLT